MITNSSDPGRGGFGVVGSHPKGKSRALLEPRRERSKGFGAGLPTIMVCGKGYYRWSWLVPRTQLIQRCWSYHYSWMMVLVYLVDKPQECFQALVSAYGPCLFLTPTVRKGWACALVAPSQGFVPMGTVHRVEKKAVHSASYPVWMLGDPGHPVTPAYCSCRRQQRPTLPHRSTGKPRGC